MLILVLTSALLLTPEPTDPREVGMEVRTARFEQILDSTVEAHRGRHLFGRAARDAAPVNRPAHRHPEA